MKFTYHIFLDVLVLFLVPVLPILVFLALRNIMRTSTVVTFKTSSIFVIFQYDSNTILYFESGMLKSDEDTLYHAGPLLSFPPNPSH